MRSPINLIAVATATFLSLCTSLHANQVMVQELSVTPNQITTISVPGFYTGQVYAGVNKLLVAGVPMDGFCIDPFHFSSNSPMLYTVVPLNQAPKDPGTMNAAQAAQICKLWAMYYTANMSSLSAAGLQIAIWEIVGGSRLTVTGSDFGASNMLASLSTYTGAGADLVGLTGPGQDYVVQRNAILSTPDGGSTLALLGLAAVVLLAANPLMGRMRCLTVRL